MPQAIDKIINANQRGASRRSWHTLRNTAIPGSVEADVELYRAPLINKDGITPSYTGSLVDDDPEADQVPNNGFKPPAPGAE